MLVNGHMDACKQMFHFFSLSCCIKLCLYDFSFIVCATDRNELNGLLDCFFFHAIVVWRTLEPIENHTDLHNIIESCVWALLT